MRRPVGTARRRDAARASAVLARRATTLRHRGPERRLCRRNVGGSVGGSVGVVGSGSGSGGGGGGGSGSRLECDYMRVLYGRGARLAACVDDRDLARTAAAAGEAHLVRVGVRVRVRVRVRVMSRVQ